MAFNFKHSDVHQDGIKIALKKYAVERAFKWIGFPPPAVVWEAMEDWALICQAAGGFGRAYQKITETILSSVEVILRWGSVFT